MPEEKPGQDTGQLLAALPVPCGRTGSSDEAGGSGSQDDEPLVGPEGTGFHGPRGHRHLHAQAIAVLLLL